MNPQSGSHLEASPLNVVRGSQPSVKHSKQRLHIPSASGNLFYTSADKVRQNFVVLKEAQAMHPHYQNDFEVFPFSLSQGIFVWLIFGLEFGVLFFVVVVVPNC